MGGIHITHTMQHVKQQGRKKENRKGKRLSEQENRKGKRLSEQENILRPE